MKLTIDPKSIDDYRKFLRIKSLPVFSIRGRECWFPDEYAARIGMTASEPVAHEYQPHPQAFDYQRDIGRLAFSKERFAIFADCGLGKTIMLLDYAANVLRVLPENQCVLIVSPLMVIDQTLSEAERFYGDQLPVERVKSSDVGEWLKSGNGRVGITNYEAFKGDNEIQKGRLGCIILDESSLLKSHYGHYATGIIELGRGIRWKLALTGTPAPNDRIEYANHAVFLDQFPNTNSFLARYFINRGQTQGRWAIKAHALEPFYRSLSHWCIFLSNPATYGWRDNCGTIPPIHVHIQPVEMTGEQDDAVRKLTGQLVPTVSGGITQRSKLARIAKGNGGEISTNKPAFIRSLVKSWPDESTLVWCKYNDEQDEIAAMFPEAANIDGSTPHEKRLELIGEFKRGERRVLISKPKILGFGLNLQIVTRQVFSTLQDSYEEFYQAVKRSNRIGSTKPLNVHVPVTDIELPMVENVLRKAKDVQADTEMQERIFRNASR